jgi:alpha-beta hydrolase superfamily lysophospholipase
VLLGHGFGSFLVRSYITEYDDIDGAVIVGSTSADTSYASLKVACSITSLLKGRRCRSSVVKKMAIGILNKAFANEDDEYSFRNSIPDQRTKIRYDGKQVFDYTVTAYKSVISLSESVCSAEWTSKVPLSLPIYVISGKNDTVSDCAESAKQLYTALEDVEINELKMDVFEGRHDVFSDIGKDDAIKALVEWINMVCEGVVACRSFNGIPFGKVDF